jgi:ABC-type multidrug transport system ATPase subunit
MTIKLENVQKRFGRQVVLRAVDAEFLPGQSYAISGPNGSGKSTLIQIIAGTLTPDKGSVTYTLENKQVAVDDIAQYLSISAPYMDLIEEFRLNEILQFHYSFKQLIPEVAMTVFAEKLKFDPEKSIKNYSSGMKQRLKFLLALFSDTKILLLDEPTANFDEEGIIWYRNLVQEFKGNRTLIIASAQPADHSFCEHKISLSL